SFFHIQLSKNRHTLVSKPSNQNPKVQLSKTQQTRQVFQFSPERRTSSLAAPPPSSVSGLIEDTPADSQQHTCKKIDIFYKYMILKDILD
ncbi:hypothetical protein, partial [Agrobacterium rosae]